MRSVDKREKGLFVGVIYMSEADVIGIEYDIYSYVMDQDFKGLSQETTLVFE